MKKIFVLLVLLFSVSSFAQITEIKKFPHPVFSGSYHASSMTVFNNNYYMFFYDSVKTDSVRLAYSKSSNGNDWSVPIYLSESKWVSFSSDVKLSIASAVFKEKLIVIFKGTNGRANLISSTDGSSFSSPVDVPLGTVIVSASTKDYFIYATTDTLFVSSVAATSITQFTNYLTRTADLVNWTSSIAIGNAKNFNLIPLPDYRKAIVYESTTDGKILFTIFNGSTYTSAVELLPANMKGYLPRMMKGGDGNYYVVFRIKYQSTLNIDQWDLAYVKSTDLITWSQPVRFTSFAGFDYLSSISPGTAEPIVTFFSDRVGLFNSNKKPGIAFASLSAPDADANAPAVVWVGNSINNISTLTLRAVFANLQEGDVKYIKYKKLHTIDSLLLFDDGLHDDSLANDQIWGRSLNGPLLLEFSYTVNIKRGNLIDASSPITILNQYTYKGYLFDVNRFKLPIANNGILADIIINDQDGGRYDGSVVLFSGGFYLSGVTPTQRWGSAVATASRIGDYAPGKVNPGLNDPPADIYVVKNEEPAFSASWLKWKDAVTLGAEFYDGNNDGVYNPVDLNSNGQWDASEDKPMVIGDAVAWCVYNDMVPASLRRFNDMNPIGVEIQQTVFAAHTNDGLNNNTVYVRYRVINKTYAQVKLDSVYFSIWGDPDLGEPFDDLVGCDTLLKSGMVYNEGADNTFGNNPPAMLSTILQGPQAYIPGVTFIDNNSNGVYDEGTDTSLDTAYAKYGPLLGVKKYPGAKNLEMSSFVHYQSSDPFLGDPNTVNEMINYQSGLARFGEPFYPCSWTLGVVKMVDCAKVNPKFMYSGNPVTQIGWLNNTPTDQRTLVNAGPFTLPYGKSVDIIAAYNLGRGTDALNSVTVAKTVAANSINMWKGNFTQLPLGVDDDGVTVNDYMLSQNYPNPFNPVTTIKFAIPAKDKVSLRIYDLLGREVSVLVNEVKEAGSYSVQFNASNLASGVYFYKLESGSFVQTKKLVLIK